MIIWFCCR